MKKLSDCRVLLVDDAKAYLDILVEGLKPNHKLSLALNGNKRSGVSLTHSGKSFFSNRQFQSCIIVFSRKNTNGIRKA